MMVYMCILYTCVNIYMSPRLPYVYECIKIYLYICIYVYIESKSKQVRASSCEFVRIIASSSEFLRGLTHPNKQELAVICKNRRDLARNHSNSR